MGYPCCWILCLIIYIFEFYLAIQSTIQIFSLKLLEWYISFIGLACFEHRCRLCELMWMFNCVSLCRTFCFIIFVPLPFMILSKRGKDFTWTCSHKWVLNARGHKSMIVTPILIFFQASKRGDWNCTYCIISVYSWFWWFFFKNLLYC